MDDLDKEHKAEVKRLLAEIERQKKQNIETARQNHPETEGRTACFCRGHRTLYTRIPQYKKRGSVYTLSFRRDL